MNIGEAARQSGVSEKMIRHYEAIGLFAPRREMNGYRSYDEPDIAVLRFIRHARELAFPLEEVRKLLTLWRDGGRTSAEVRRIALDHVQALEAKAHSLSTIAASLRHLAANCHGDSRPDCPILEELAQPQEMREHEHGCAAGGGHELRALRPCHFGSDPLEGSRRGGARRSRIGSRAC